jgi:hypothetical protein
MLRRAIVLGAVAAGLAASGAALAAPMTATHARRLVPKALRHEYGGQFSGRSLTRSCLRGPKVRCAVAWRKWPFAYTGTVTLWYSPADAAARYATYTYSALIARRNIRPRRPTVSRRSAGP